LGDARHSSVLYIGEYFVVKRIRDLGEVLYEGLLLLRYILPAHLDVDPQVLPF
jgi:hypothetical protein